MHRYHIIGKQSAVMENMQLEMGIILIYNFKEFHLGVPLMEPITECSQRIFHANNDSTNSNIQSQSIFQLKKHLVYYTLTKAAFNECQHYKNSGSNSSSIVLNENSAHLHTTASKIKE